jgi:hypothetical protein
VAGLISVGIGESSGATNYVPEDLRAP